jgi:hypothetical protein
MNLFLFVVYLHRCHELVHRALMGAVAFPQSKILYAQVRAQRDLSLLAGVGETQLLADIIQVISSL